MTSKKGEADGAADALSVIVAAAQQFIERDSAAPPSLMKVDDMPCLRSSYRVSQPALPPRR